jgi:ADP-ribose pyrophosphatase YjhB (NUDIX family)
MIKLTEEEIQRLEESISRIPCWVIPNVLQAALSWIQNLLFSSFARCAWGAGVDGAGYEVWLVRHTYLPMAGFCPAAVWSGGRRLKGAARREAREELGAELEGSHSVGRLHEFWQWKTDHTAVFLSTDFKITGKSDGEIAEVRAFPLEQLPEDTYNSHRSLLDAYRKGEKLPNFGEW